MIKSVYVAGSMRNPRVTQVAKLLREQGFEVFDDWYSPGEQADNRWQEYEKDRGRTYAEALDGYHAKHVFDLDHHHLKRCDAFVLVMPAGKSAHIELGWFCKDKPAFVLFDKEPERYDIMYRFVYETGGAVVFSDQELLGKLGKKAPAKKYRRRTYEDMQRLRGGQGVTPGMLAELPEEVDSRFDLGGSVASDEWRFPSYYEEVK